MKNTLTDLVNCEKMIWKVRHDVINLEKNLKYFKIPESAWYENLTKHYLWKGIFSYVFLYPER